MIITFCGHKTIGNVAEVDRWLDSVLAQFADAENPIFYLGGCGGFDNAALDAVKRLKIINPTAKSILVIPYLGKKYCTFNYDETVYPSLENIPPRFAILKRNEWMVENSDILIAYVRHDYGGAAKTLVYAKRKKKTIIPFEE